MKTELQLKSDMKLKDDVLAELKWESSVKESQIGVIVEDGIVTLAGTTETWAEKSAAERAAQRVSGVRALANEIQVKIPNAIARPDADVARAAVNALQWHVFVPSECVQVSVDHGSVTLKGEVDGQYRKAAAADAVRHLWGVRSVVNEIVVNAGAAVEDVKGMIVLALERNAMLDAALIQVEAHGGRIVLKGTVRTWAEKSEAGNAAWLAPGVTHVENDLRVMYEL